MRHYNIPIFIPELACPHQCVFCDQEKISGHSHIPKPSDVRDIVNEHLQSFTATERHINIAFFGGSFTGIDRKLQEEYLKEAHTFILSGEVDGIRLSTRPDYIDREIVQMLKGYGVTCIELGAQSLHPEVLNLTGRGHSISETEFAAEVIKEAGIELGLQMMLGLPADTKERSMQTAQKIAELGAQNTRIYPTLVIEGTALAQMYKSELYTPLTMDEAIDWAKDVYQFFLSKNITVLRTGLHPSEEFDEGKSLLAGPYHPAFKELVLTQIWNDQLLSIPQTNNGLEISVPPKQINYAIGHKQKNRKELQSKWKHVKFIPDPSLSNFQFQVL